MLLCVVERYFAVVINGGKYSLYCLLKTSVKYFYNIKSYTPMNFNIKYFHIRSKVPDIPSIIKV